MVPEYFTREDVEKNKREEKETMNTAQVDASLGSYSFRDKFTRLDGA
jgi:hypothetical protein